MSDGRAMVKGLLGLWKLPRPLLSRKGQRIDKDHSAYPVDVALCSSPSSLARPTAGVLPSANKKSADSRVEGVQLGQVRARESSSRRVVLLQE